MTRVDRYILFVFLRTVLVCFFSIAGIFVVFHAFGNMDKLVSQGEAENGLIAVAVRVYGPYMLLLFDMTAAIIALMSFMMTVGWLRYTGELTAILSAGISHGRIFRPMIVASSLIVVVQLVNREFILPEFRDAMSMRAKDLAGNTEQSIGPQFDKMNLVLLDGESLNPQTQTIRAPNFRLDGDLPGFGDQLTAKTAQWMEGNERHPSGYLLDGVQRPPRIDQIPSVRLRSRPVMMTSHDHPWLKPRQCFFATSVHTEFLQLTDTERRASIAELLRRIRNPAIHSSSSLRVVVHERFVRPPLDFSLILLGLPLMVNVRGRNIFVMIGAAMIMVVGFFAIKTFASAMGGSGYLLSPAMAAWVPLLILGPVAYVRLREIEFV